MRSLYGIVILCFIPALLSAVIHFFLNKEVGYKKNYVKDIVFYLFVFYGILSGIKFLLGESNNTLWESFTDIVPQTYAHYAIPIVIIVILCPIVLKIILKERKEKVIDFFDSMVFCIAFLTYVIEGRVSNLEYFIFFVFSGMISIGVCLLKKGEIGYCTTKEEKKKRFLYVFPILLLYTVTVLIYMPNELYLSNVRDFQFTYGSFLGVILIGSIIFIIIGICGSIFLATNRQFEIFCYTIFILSFMGYIQGNFLNGALQALDGTKQIWSVSQKGINLVIWLVVTLGGGIILFVYRKKLQKVICVICTYICLMQIASLLFLIVTTDLSKTDEYALTTNAMLELHEDNNVIVFVLDWFDEQIMEKVAAEEPEILNSLTDFTWYQNATSCYAYTNMSIPYLLTGVKWDYEMMEEEYCQYAYASSDFLQTIAEQNYDIGIYTDDNVVDLSVKDIVSNYQNVVERKCNFIDTMYMIQKCSKYKMAPFALKEKYWYATSDLSFLLVNDSAYVTRWDIDFKRDLETTRISIQDRKNRDGAFRFYHLYGAHMPYVMNQEGEYTQKATMIEQAKGCMIIVFEYLEQMKKLGIYEDATIIITADHGQNTYLSAAKVAEEAGFETTSNPILFVKEGDEGSKTNMNISLAPVSHEEFIPTVLNAIGIEQVGDRRTFKEILENEDRDRFFVHGINDWFVKYRIDGNVRDIRNWEIVP